jgi:hypothetical protein
MHEISSAVVGKVSEWTLGEVIIFLATTITLPKRLASDNE